jgi:hypothetical protein
VSSCKDSRPATSGPGAGILGSATPRQRNPSSKTGTPAQATDRHVRISRADRFGFPKESDGEPKLPFVMP